MWDKFIGPATIVYLVSITVAGVWWASDLSSRVSASERVIGDNAKANERLVRLETLVQSVDGQLHRIEDKLDARPTR